MTAILPTALVFVLIISIASTLRADILTSEQKDFYREHNAAMDTLRINDNSGLDVDAAGNNVTLASLFNKYFGTDYSSSQALFDELGVKEIVSTWTVNENARIEASFKSAALGQTLSILDSMGNTVASQTFIGGIFDDGLGGEPIHFDVAGLYGFTLDTGENVFSGSNANPDGLIHLLAFDVTTLMQAKLPNEPIESAYLLAWEDLDIPSWYSDFDYQDLAYIMVNASPVLTPEPSSLLILGIGGVGFLLLRKRTAAGPTQVLP